MKDAENLHPVVEPWDKGYSQEQVEKDIYKQMDIEEELIEEGKRGLCDQYEITNDQLLKIIGEGVEKGWRNTPIHSWNSNP